MQVGVFLGEFTPEAGGGYTFVNDVAEAFLTIAGESPHKFSLFCTPSTAQQLTKRGLPQNVKAVPLAPRGIFGKTIAALKHLSPFFSVLWRWPSALERAARRESVALIWFVGGFFDTPNIPYITTVWDVQHLTHPWFPEVSARGRWDYREAFIRRHVRRAMRIITGTHAGKQQLMGFYGLEEHRIALLPHPTPAFALMPRDNAAKSSITQFGLRDKFLLYPAQFWAHKNHMNVLLALDVLRTRGHTIPDIALVGSDKGNRAYIEAQSKRLDLTANVHFLGFVSVEELIGLYQAAGALLYASFSGPENLPPLEAFAIGCPVINGDFPGAKEQLGDAAHYMNAHDPESIANAIETVLSNSRDVAEKSAMGIERAKSWTAEHYTRSALQLINECDHERRCWQ